MGSRNSLVQSSTKPAGQPTGKLKGYKVTSADRQRMCGVACSSLAELKKKGCGKLNILPLGLLVQIQDGTLIEDEEYFQTLPPQTIFILLKPGESIVTGADLIYNALAAVNSEYLRAGKLAQEFLSVNLQGKVREFAAIVDRQKPSIRMSSRAEDPEWFAGLDTRAQTKEKFMFIRSQERIRGYLYKTVDEIKRSEAYKTNRSARTILDEMIAEFRNGLKKNQDFGCLFDRSRAAEEGRLCDEIGEFLCEGRWDKNTCLYDGDHRINPYESREARVLFSTWNLDHGVERSRTVIPAILSAACNPIRRDPTAFEALHVNAFTLLFMRDNLKLVHIICHDKGEHGGIASVHLQRLQELYRGDVGKRSKQQSEEKRRKLARLIT